MLKIFFFFTLILISLSSCFRRDYSKYRFYFKPQGVTYQGEKEGLEIVLKDIQHINRYKPEATATLIVTCKNKHKSDTLQVSINTQHQDWRYRFSSDSMGADVLFEDAEMRMYAVGFYIYCSDSVVLDKDWYIALKRFPALIQR